MSTPHPLEARLAAPGPKRLLALDGGGIRGLVTVGYLQEIETLLRHRHGRNDLVLSDYFDLIGGTSTGAIIAAMLALGLPVAEIRERYLSLGESAFKPKRHLLGPLGRLLGVRFEEESLAGYVRDMFGDRTLDSHDLRTGLLLVLKRADTASVWAITNAPGQVYYEMNRKLELRKLIMSSTAAPSFFRPQLIRDVGDGHTGVFIDGGVSMHANPALLVLMAATLEGFGLQWPMGSSRLLLCSVGTGSYVSTAPPEALPKYNNLQWAGILMRQLMRDASELNQTVLQWLSSSPTAKPIDSQLGRLEGDLMGPEPLLSYIRYDVDLDKPDLDALGFDLSEKDLLEIRRLEGTENIPTLTAIGEAAARAQVSETHFAASFDARADHEAAQPQT